VLTEYGRQLAEAFAKRFNDFEIDVEEASQLWSDPSRRVLRVGARREILLDRFAVLEFSGKLNLVPMGSRRIEHELMKQSLDIAVVQVEVDTPEYVAKKLFASRTELLMPKRWSRDMPGARDFNTLCGKHPFATFSSERPYLESFASEFSLAAIPEPNLIANDWPIVEERVHKQMAWTIAPSSLAREGRGYWRIELPESIGWQEFFLYTRRSLSRQPWFRELVGKIGKRSS
jgi:DNA-binding transcriptional LysR family regulator